MYNGTLLRPEKADPKPIMGKAQKQLDNQYRTPNRFTCLVARVRLMPKTLDS